MSADTTALDPMAASPVDLLLLADEAEEAGAAWEEAAWLRLRAGQHCALIIVGVSAEGRPGTAQIATKWDWWQRVDLFGRTSPPGRCWHDQAGQYHPQPPAEVRRLVEAAAGEAVRRVLESEGVTGAAPGA